MRRFVPYLVIVLWVSAWHGRALTGYFYGDDWFQITPRPWSVIARTFAGDWNQGDQHQGGFYRPMVRVSFALDRILWGDSPAGYHFTGLLLLAANALLLRALARRVLRSDSLAMSVALAFVLLPTQAETAWWVSARADLLAGLGVLAALVLWIRLRVTPDGSSDLSLQDARNPDQPQSCGFFLARQRPLAVRRLMPVWAGLIFGLLAKETAAAGLLLIPILDALLLPEGIAPSGKEADPPHETSVPRNPSSSVPGSWGSRSPWTSWGVCAFLPSAVIAVAYLAWRTCVLGGIGGYLASSSEPMTLSRVGETYRLFLSGLLWPPGTAGAYGLDWKPWVVVFGAGLLVSRFRRDLVFAVAAVLVSIVPMVGLGLSPLAGGRYMLLPGAFGVLAWAALVSPSLRRMARPFRWIPAFALVAFSLLWAPTLLRASTLWSSASEPNRRAFEQTWSIVERLPCGASGQMGIVPAPIPHGYHVWAPGYTLSVALQARARSQGWQAEWVDLDKPYPSPIEIRRPDGMRIRAWFGVPPDLLPGSLILQVQSDGAVKRLRVRDVERTAWDAPHLAGWIPQGPGTIRGVQRAGNRAESDEFLSAPPWNPDRDTASSSTLEIVVEGPGFWLSPPGTSDETTSGTALAVASSRSRRGTRWVLVAITGRWNRAGTAFLAPVSEGHESPLPASSLFSSPQHAVLIAVPPSSPHHTAYAQAELKPWPLPSRLCPINRPARVALERVELIGFVADEWSERLPPMFP